MNDGDTTSTYTTLQFVVKICPTCSAITGMTREHYDRWRMDSSVSWHCISCQQGWVCRDNDVTKLKRQLQTASDARDFYKRRSEYEERSKAAVRGHLTRVKKRIANGVCPCCQRSFKDLARHMQGQHPEYAGAQPE